MLQTLDIRQLPEATVLQIRKISLPGARTVTPMQQRLSLAGELAQAWLGKARSKRGVSEAQNIEFRGRVSIAPALRAIEASGNRKG